MSDDAIHSFGWKQTRVALRSPFVRSVVVVASGAAGAQAIAVAVSPVLTRIYSAEAFGMLGTFTAILSLAAPIAALTYPTAVVLPRRDEEALKLLRLSAIITLAVSSLLTVAIWLGGESAASALGFELIDAAAFWLPLAVLLTAFNVMAKQWLIRKGAFGVVARTALLRSSFVNGAKVLTGFVFPVGITLIVLTVMGQAVHSLLMVSGIRRRTSIRYSDPPNAKEPTIAELAWRHRDFPLFRMPQDFINAVSQSFPIILIAGLFGPEAAGFYVLSRIVMGAPSALVGASVYDVLYPRLSEAVHRGEDLYSMIVKATVGLAAISILPFGLVVIFGPMLFGFIFGGEWAAAGEYARWLALLFLFNMINKPSVAAVPLLGIQRGLLIYEIISTTSKLVGLLIGAWVFENDLWGIAAFSTIGMVAYAIMIFWIISCARSRGRNEKTG